jgi:hypothetical protein
MSHDDFEVEPIPGLPAVPPDGERILWSGSPHWPSLARHAFHVDKVAIYFALLIAWRMGSQWYDGQSSAAAFASAVAPLAAAAIAITILALIAYVVARSTIYTITSRRIVMRFGAALPITFNLPFASIFSAGLRKFSDSSGDIPIHLGAEKRLPYLVLWPHVRPWHVNSPQPMLRCVHEAPRVAEVLSRALASHTATALLTDTAGVRADTSQSTDAISPSAPRLVAAE